MPYVGKAAYASSPFTRSHLRGAAYVGVDGPDAGGTPALSRGAHRVVLAYHDVIDKLAHAEGLGAAYDAAIGRRTASSPSCAARCPTMWRSW